MQLPEKYKENFNISSKDRSGESGSREKARLAPSLSFIVISIHYSVHYMT
jgi:hypothetical protein